MNGTPDITRELIKKGLEHHIIDLLLSSDGLRAYIGDHWFYFGGTEYEWTEPSEIPKEILVDEIKFALDGMVGKPYQDSEYRYYYAYITSMLQLDAEAKLEISKMLTLSTAHIKEETAATIKEHSSPWVDYDLVIYDKDSFGWWIHLPEEEIMELRDVPDDLKACIKLAESKECDWLCLDHDGQITELLPTYEWE